MVWNLEDNPIDHKELEIYKYIKQQSGNTQFAHTVSRFIALRDYVDAHRFDSPADLRKNVLSNGSPLFSKSESEQVFKLTAKTGGVTGTELSVADNVVNQWARYLYEWQPGFIRDGVDAVSPYIFISKTLEAGKFGPIFSVALDAITATLPSIAATLEDLTPQILGFVPLPEAGPVGAIIGWLLASIFIILGMLIHLSRQHFGQAFVMSFLLIPFLGISLYNGALSGERFLTRTSARRERMINTVSDLFGKEAAVAVEAVTPDLLEEAPTHSTTSVEQLSGGGRRNRLSRRAPSKGKWRTRRRSKL